LSWDLPEPNAAHPWNMSKALVDMVNTFEAQKVREPSMGYENSIGKATLAEPQIALHETS